MSSISALWAPTSRRPENHIPSRISSPYLTILEGGLSNTLREPLPPVLTQKHRAEESAWIPRLAQASGFQAIARELAEKLIDATGGFHGDVLPAQLFASNALDLLAAADDGWFQ